MEIASARTAEERSNQDQVDEEVFKKAYIPRTLNEVSYYERDVDAMKKEQESKQNDNILYQTVTGLKKDLSGVQTVPSLLEGCAEEGNSSNDEEKEDALEFGGDHTQEQHSQDQTQAVDKKAKKKLVKEARREKRKNKVPKHVKKRKEKVAKIKKGR